LLILCYRDFYSSVARKKIQPLPILSIRDGLLMVAKRNRHGETIVSYMVYSNGFPTVGTGTMQHT
jgi:hypothetical protein